MISYTEAEKQAWLSDEKTLSLSFSDNTTVDYTSIISESMEITYSLCSENELRWGRCNPTQFKISLTASNKNYKGLYVTPTLICGQYSRVIGTFLVVEDKKEDDSTIHTLTCYDKLYEINSTDYASWYNAINWSNITTIGAFRNAFFSHIGLTQVTEGTFYSDSISINKPIAECTSLTGETILRAILELEGCFGRILPDGKFKHEYVEVYVDGIYPATDLYPDTALYPAEGNVSRYFHGDIYQGTLSYSNYQTDKISHLIIRADADDVGGSASITSTTENTYIVQGNFLMAGQSSTVLNGMATWLLDRLKDYYLYPGSFTVQGRPWVEVGDSVFGQGLVDIVQFPILELRRKGINALADTYKAQHIKNYDEQITSVPSSVIELNEKTNKFIRTVDETISELTDATEGLQSQITQNAGAITAEVRRATQAEGSLSSSLSLVPRQISLAVSAEQSRAEGVESGLSASLDLKIDNTDDGTIISLINGSANHINFIADNMFTVQSTNFTVSDTGVITANSASLTNVTLKENTTIKDQWGDSMGIIGRDTADNGVEVLAFKNTVGNTKIMFGNVSYASNWLWLKAGGYSVVHTGTEFEPYTDGAVSLGYSAYGTNKRWSTIKVVDAPWSSSSDKRMKDVKGEIQKAVDFYMKLHPVEYSFKEGIEGENPEQSHFGLIAQDVLQSYEECYNNDKQGIVFKQKIADESTREVVGEDERYVLNYNELHAFHIQMIQELRKEVDELKEEINELRKELKHE